MPKIENRYEDLQVAKNAPPEVVRAAFKTLTQKHHPDKNPGDKNATETMKRINEAYEVLSDPKKRAEHDKALEKEDEKRLQEYFLKEQAKVEERARAKAKAEDEPRAQAQKSAEPEPPRQPHSAPQRPTQQKDTSVLARVADYLWSHKLLTVLVSFGISVAFSASSTPSKTNAAAVAKQNATATMCVAMPTDSQGARWPNVASDVKLANPVANKGGSKLTIDNTKGGSPVFVKLKKESMSLVVRSAYIPVGQQYTMQEIGDGPYQLLYKDLASGCNYASYPFTLGVTNQNNGAPHTSMVYDVPPNSSSLKRIPEVEFR